MALQPTSHRRPPSRDLASALVRLENLFAIPRGRVMEARVEHLAKLADEIRETPSGAPRTPPRLTPRYARAVAVSSLFKCARLAFFPWNIRAKAVSITAFWPRVYGDYRSPRSQPCE